VGLSWQAKKEGGEVLSFHSLEGLRQLLEDKAVEVKDAISYDNRVWIPLHSVENLSGFFTELWKRAERGELKRSEDPDDTEEETVTTFNSENSDPAAVTSYRTTQGTHPPSYLASDLAEDPPTAEEVVGVNNPLYLGLTKPKGKRKDHEPPDSPDQKLILALTVIFACTLVFAVLVVFDINVPFLTQRTSVGPQQAPTITTPTSVPTVPDHEAAVPTGHTVVTDEGAIDPTETPPSPIEEDPLPPEIEQPAPPTGDLTDDSGETP